MHVVFSGIPALYTDQVWASKFKEYLGTIRRLPGDCIKELLTSYVPTACLGFTVPGDGNYHNPTFHLWETN